MPQDNSKDASTTIKIRWSGPFQPEEILKRFNDGGAPPQYDGHDYGLYQIYGTHILGGPNTLLYVGRAIQQTFSSRFSAHQSWLDGEKGISRV